MAPWDLVKLAPSFGIPHLSDTEEAEPLKETSYQMTPEQHTRAEKEAKHGERQ